MFFVYILRSRIDDKLYVGHTVDVDKRLGEHNSGYVDATRDRKPFDLMAYIAVDKRNKAIELEKYFKSGSGRAFISRHLM